jgi:hypothetical protein
MKKTPKKRKKKTTTIWDKAHKNVPTLEKVCGISPELGSVLRAALQARRQAERATPPSSYPVIVPHEAIWFWERLQHEETQSAWNKDPNRRRGDKVITAAAAGGKGRKGWRKVDEAMVNRVMNDFLAKGLSLNNSRARTARTLGVCVSTVRKYGPKK